MYEQSIEKLRAANYKITTARTTVLQVLHESEGHLTSSEIVERVAEIDPEIGRASVFRTLDLLIQLSLVRPTYIDTRAMVYVLLEMDGHHSHIVCTNCSRVIEIDDCALGTYIETLQQKYNIQLTGHLLEMYGICAQCQS